MKTFTATLLLTAMSTCALAQGFVNFANNPTTLVTRFQPPATLISGAGSYYFGLLLAPAGTTDPRAFQFTGVYATNSAAAPGRFVLNSVQVYGWAPGVTKSYEIAGWSASLGATFNPVWLWGPWGVLSASQRSARVPPVAPTPLVIPSRRTTCSVELELLQDFL